eukprot:8292184-Ditylum_brightwellii.AAC.1
MPQETTMKPRPPTSRMHQQYAKERQAEHKHDNETTTLSFKEIFKKASTVNMLKSIEKHAKWSNTPNKRVSADYKPLTKQHQQSPCLETKAATKQMILASISSPAQVMMGTNIFDEPHARNG